MDNALDIAVRGWPDFIHKNASSYGFKLHRIPGRLLVFDTESDIDQAQTLTFGSAKDVWITYPSKGDVKFRHEPKVNREIIFYADDLPQRDPAGYQVLIDYCIDRDLELISQHQFVIKYLWQCINFKDEHATYTLTGFNVPFDVSRLAYGYGVPKGDKYKGGFAFRMFQTGDKMNPNYTIKNLDSKKHFSKGFERLDVRTLVWALTNKSASLARACEMFQLPDEYSKGHAEEHGKITPEYIDYNRQDVTATVFLALAALKHYHEHPIGLDPRKAMSPASIGKSYLKAMNVPPMFDRDVPKDPVLIGNTMSAFYGGRAECRIRNTPVPVSLVDFTSMYTTVNANMKLWNFITAQGMEVHDISPEEATAFFDSLNTETLLNRATWPELTGYAQILPDDDIFPVRAPYGEAGGLNVGVNRLTSSTPLWYSYPDIAASRILTGKSPKILRAVKFTPGEKLVSLRPVKLMGKVHVEPDTEDFFVRVIEQRSAIKNQHPKPVPADCSCDRCRTQEDLKTIANSTSYGVYVEMNSEDLTQQGQQRVHGAFGKPWAHTGSTVEKPGEFCYPPIGGLITGAARLMLAILEKLVTDAGGNYAMTDTDSMAIVSTLSGGEQVCSGVTALSYEQVDAIRSLMNHLNPYNPELVPQLLKADPGCYMYVISAKRYVMFYYENGLPVVPSEIAGKRAYMEHALGLYLNPADITSPDRNWMREAWQYLLDLAHGLNPKVPAWADRPALTRSAVTTTALMRNFRDYNRGRDYQDAVKPFNFMLLASESSVNESGPINNPRRIVTGFSTDPEDWESAEWYDLHNPDAPPLHIGQDIKIKTMFRVIRDYRLHPESKSLGPDSRDCGPLTHGLLKRRHVRVNTVAHIGKESNKLEEQLDGLIANLHEVQVFYGSPTGQELVGPTRWCAYGCGNPVPANKDYCCKSHYEYHRRRRNTTPFYIEDIGWDIGDVA